MKKDKDLLESELETARGVIEYQEEQFLKLSEEKADLEEQNRIMEQEIKRLQGNQEVLMKVSHEKVDLEEKLEIKDAIVDSLDKDCNRYLEDIKSLNYELEALKREHQDLEVDFETLKDGNIALSDRVRILSQKKEALEGSNLDLNERIEGLTKDHDDLYTEFEEALKSAEKAKDDYRHMDDIASGLKKALEQEFEQKELYQKKVDGLLKVIEAISSNL